MSETPVEIDMMELADVAQPSKIAYELHRQLRAQFGSIPRRIPLTGIADAIGIAGIAEFDTDHFEGTLVIKDGIGAIGLRRGLGQGRRNFTLAHEIGHFLIPNHRFQRVKFECVTADINKRRVREGDWANRPHLERIEIEANEFSAALLVPSPEFQEERRRLSASCDISHVRRLAELFAVSHEMMAQIYVNSAQEKAAIITSKNFAVKRVMASTGFPYLGLKAGSPLPPQAMARTLRLGLGENISDLREVLTDYWLERRGSVSAVYEQVLFQKNGWATTLLLVDENEAEEEEDDSHWNRRYIRH
jgi:hypothetical protein